MIVDYHVHLRGSSENGEGPIELTAAAAERFTVAGGARPRLGVRSCIATRTGER